MATALNDAHGTQVDPSFIQALGLEALRMEWAFNKAAGFTEKDDELPEFFYAEALAPSNKTARHPAPVNRSMRGLLAAAGAGRRLVPQRLFLAPADASAAGHVLVSALPTV
jgi:aldehyde:ferredoxin oxidoreductase